MKYIKEYNENSYIKGVAEECEDILIAIRDERMNTTVESKTRAVSRRQRIEIFIDPRPGEGSMIDLSDQAETLERLICYLDSEGFRLVSGRYESMHSHDVCPNCGSEEIKSSGYDDPTDSFYSECLDCSHQGDEGIFSSSYWRISAQDELMSAIKRKIHMLELEFDKKI